MYHRNIQRIMGPTKSYEVVVDNLKAGSHNINIDRPTFFCFAENQEEAVGKMMLSDFKYKYNHIVRIHEKDFKSGAETVHESFRSVD